MLATTWEVLIDVSLKYTCYNLKASCPLLSRPKLYSPQDKDHEHTISRTCPASEAAKAPFLLRPLSHHLSFISDVPVACQFCDAVLPVLSPCTLS